MVNKDEGNELTNRLQKVNLKSISGYGNPIDTTLYLNPGIWGAVPRAKTSINALKHNGLKNSSRSYNLHKIETSRSYNLHDRSIVQRLQLLAMQRTHLHHTRSAKPDLYTFSFLFFLLHFSLSSGNKHFVVSWYKNPW